MDDQRETGGSIRDAIRVVVVDDHDLFRRGLRDLLIEQGLQVIGEASNGDDAVRLVSHAVPDVVVMDLNMPRLSGVEATRRITSRTPLTKVLVLTISADESSVMEAIEAGASGYLLKEASIEEISEGVRAAAAGEALISPRIAAKLLDRLRPGGEQAEPEAATAELTEREREVLRLVAEGKDNAEIAEELVISIGTAKNHISNILAKLHMVNRIQAAVYAVRQRMI